MNSDHEAKEQELIMPHNTYSEKRLNELYPPLTVPEAVDAEDPLAGVQDQLVEAGLKEARSIMKTAELRGRLRRSSEHVQEGKITSDTGPEHGNGPEFPVPGQGGQKSELRTSLSYR